MPHRSELLERDEELAALAATIDLVAGGSGRVTAIEGAAGLGKSRIVAEARRLASAAGLAVFLARGSDLEHDFAFGVVRQLFEPTLVRMDHCERDELLSGAASQATVAVLSEAGSPAGAAGDFAILHGLFWLTANLAERRPLALIVDDLHWADVASLRFLAYLLPRLDDLRVAVILALRPYAEATAAARLLGQLTADPSCVTLRPAPLTAAAAGLLVQQVLDEPVEPAFVAACHSATRGNPLLLKELAATVKAKGLTPTADNVNMVDVLGPKAVARRVALWLDRLPRECVLLARSVSVLGDGVELHNAAELSALPQDGAAQAARILERADLFRPVETGRGDGIARVRFAHPLVRAAIYDGIDPAERVTAHRRAAQLLVEPEQVAAQLMRVGPAGDGGVVATLRRAAADALARGSPDTAVTYLRRCLAEPPGPDDRPDVLWELGKTATLVDTDAAVRDLAAALELTTDPRRRAEIAVALGTALFYLIRFDDAVRVWLAALAELPEGEVDLRRRLEAGLLIIPLIQPGHGDLAAREGALRSADDHDSVGARALDCLLAAHQAWHADPAAVPSALRGLRGGVLAEQVYADTPSVLCGWLVLLTADRDEAIASIDGAIAHAHRGGSVRGLATAHTFRGLAWLWRGQLAEAEMNFREALRHVDAARVELGPLVPGCFLADALIELGRLDEAQRALDALGIPEPAPPFGPLYWYLDSRARLLRQQGRVEQGLETALATGQRYALHGGVNPAFLSWRTEAALCAHRLGRTDQARELAGEDLVLARRWGAPRALGRALRVCGLTAGGADGLRLLGEAVTVLERSPARLEHAAALVDLGSALRRAGSRADARSCLTKALDIAEICGATLVRDRARGELRAAGVRPPRTRPTGPAALTPSERRVAELAAAGHSNRDIAERLFVTVKTVEIHLTNAYRKLGVSGRDKLRECLPA